MLFPLRLGSFCERNLHRSQGTFPVILLFDMPPQDILVPQDKTKKELFNHCEGFQGFGVSGMAAPALLGLGTKA